MNYNKPIIKDGKVKCEICQKFFLKLSGHIKKHGLSAIDYRVHCHYKLTQEINTIKTIYKGTYLGYRKYPVS